MPFQQSNQVFCGKFWLNSLRRKRPYLENDLIEIAWRWRENWLISGIITVFGGVRGSAVLDGILEGRL